MSAFTPVGDGVVTEAVRPCDEPLARLERERRGEAVRRAETPEVGRQLFARQAHVALRLGPQLERSERRPVQLGVRGGRIAESQAADERAVRLIVRDAEVELHAGAERLHHADAAVLAAHTLDVELLARMLG
jgi:hypothetical protein